MSIQQDLFNSLDIRNADNLVTLLSGGRIIEVCRGLKKLSSKIRSLDQITLHEIAAGIVTANHCHQIKYEVMLAFEPLEVFLKNLDFGNTIRVQIGKFQMFDLPPGIAHAIYNPHPVGVYMLELTNLEFDPKEQLKDLTKLCVADLSLPLYQP